MARLRKIAIREGVRQRDTHYDRSTCKYRSKTYWDTVLRHLDKNAYR